MLHSKEETIPAKAFQDIGRSGIAGISPLGLYGLSPREGGLPLMLRVRIIGGFGVAGANSDQDGAASKAAADAVNHSLILLRG